MQQSEARVSSVFWKNLLWVGATAALIVAVLLLMALIDLVTANLRTGTVFQDNFIILIFKLHAGFSGVQVAALEGLNALDVSILILVGVMFLSIYPALKLVNKIWATVAVSLPFIGLLLYIVTRDIGRSGVIAAGLICALIMSRSDAFSKRSAYLGILANLALLIGDVGTGFTYLVPLAIMIGIGYILFLTWCILLGVQLFAWARAPQESSRREQ